MALPSLSSCWYRTLIYGTMEGIRTCMYYTLRLSTAITFYVLPEENEFVLLNLSNSTKSPGQLIHLFNQNSNLNTLWHWLIARYLVHVKVWLLCRTVLVVIATQSHCDILALNKYEHSLQVYNSRLYKF